MPISQSVDEALLSHAMNMDVPTPKPLPLVISATFTAEPIATGLHFWIDSLGMNYELTFAPYNQISQSLLNPGSEFWSGPEGVNVVLLRWEDLDERDAVEGNALELSRALKTYAAASTRPLLVLICPSCLESSRYEAVETRFLIEMQGVSGVYMLPRALYRSWYPMEECYDSEADRLGRIPYTSEGFAALATVVARRLDGLRRSPFKVIVLDCDNTLWGGVLGEDGAPHLRLDPPFRALQSFMCRQQEAGMLLALASKNNHVDVEEAFRLRTEMPLRLDHFVACQVNWRPKSENIRELASLLDLGLDAFIFVDDSAAECAEVRAHCPEVSTLQLPKESDTIPLFLEHVWAFDQWVITGEDTSRSAVYAQKLERERVLRQATNMAEFLSSLDLDVKISAVNAESLPRVVQLMQRTNQFNCTTVRHSEAELRALFRERYKCFTVDVSDRFGSYGLVGAVVYRTMGAELDVDTLLLSCRALGRGVEHRMVQHLGEIALGLALNTVRIPFRSTAKNVPAKSFLESIGSSWQRVSQDGFFIEMPASAAAAVRYVVSETALPDVQKAESKVNKRLNGDAEISEPKRFLGYEEIATGMREMREVAARAQASQARTLKVSIAGQVEPRTELEANLCAMWASVLELPAVGVHQDFFDLGGCSLSAIRLFSRMHRELEATLPENILFECPTVAQLAQKILDREAGYTGMFRAVPIQPKGDKHPLFWIPGGRGIRVLAYREISYQLGKEQPVYGLESPRLEDSESVPTIREKARAYIKCIRAVQPTGPYQIAGFCLGGVVAFEMAQQLLEVGERLGLLALIDADLPGKRFSPMEKLHRRMQRIAFHSRKHGLVYAGAKLGRALVGMSALQRQTSTVRSIEAAPLDSSTMQEELIDWARYIGNYQPQPYAGELIVFVARDTEYSGVEERLDPRLAWHEVAASTRTYLLAGGHESILQAPYVGEFAAALRKELSANSS